MLLILKQKCRHCEFLAESPEMMIEHLSEHIDSLHEKLGLNSQTDDVEPRTVSSVDLDRATIRRPEGE